MKDLAIIAFMLLMLATTVSAATIYGAIYDFSLDKAKDVRLEINTEPKQLYISKNGSYAFEVPVGDYTIEAKQYTGNLLTASISENITVKDNGAYVLDLILFPSINEDELEEDIDISDPFEEGKTDTAIISALIIFIIILFFAVYKKSKSQVKGKDKFQEDYDLEKVIKILKEEGGRATQKEIRKQIPLSEAKISLMIAELEHKGIIQKIKKGRGNIIILKK